jgi:hypothetical protein
MADLPMMTTPNKTAPPCWICNRNEANSGEHKTKRSDLLAVLGKPTQEAPFYYHDLHKANRPVGSLDAKILKSPVRICADCNTARTQPHDRAWEHMSDWLRTCQQPVKVGGFTRDMGHQPVKVDGFVRGTRQQPLKVGGFVRGNRIFPHNTRIQMKNVHLFFLKLFGCMICEAEANGHKLPIDIAPFSKAIMSSRPHPEVHLQFGKCDGTIGRSNLHCWTTQGGSVLAGWLYELDTIAVSVLFAQGGRWERRSDLWHPFTGSNRFQIADFQYKRRTAAGISNEETA